MKQEFLKLLEINYDKEYLDFINLLKLESGETIKEAFDNDSILERENKIKHQVFNSIDPKDWKKLANPYYIGFGNPSSNILIIGKEKAFDYTKKDLLIKESINNYIQWKKIVSSYSQKIDQSIVNAEIGFSPLLPKAYHSSKTKKRSTWKIISELINQVIITPKSLDEVRYLEKSIFGECFLTELNYIPAKYNEGTGLIEIRKKFLSQDFYKTFPTVIIGAKNYIKKKTEIQIKDIFNADYHSEIYLETIGTSRKRDLVLKKYLSETQTIFICDQLSGASGWTKKSLTKFAQEISGGNI